MHQEERKGKEWPVETAAAVTAQPKLGVVTASYRMELKRQDTPYSREHSTRQGMKIRLQWGLWLRAYH